MAHKLFGMIALYPGRAQIIQNHNIIFLHSWALPHPFSPRPTCNLHWSKVLRICHHPLRWGRRSLRVSLMSQKRHPVEPQNVLLWNHRVTTKDKFSVIPLVFPCFGCLNSWTIEINSNFGDTWESYSCIGRSPRPMGSTQVGLGYIPQKKRDHFNKEPWGSGLYALRCRDFPLQNYTILWPGDGNVSTINPTANREGSAFLGEGNLPMDFSGGRNRGEVFGVITQVDPPFWKVFCSSSNLPKFQV